MGFSKLISEYFIDLAPDYRFCAASTRYVVVPQPLAERFSCCETHQRRLNSRWIFIRQFHGMRV